MGNLLPTITIVLAEITAGLLVVLFFLLYRFRKLRLRHQAELDTLMGIAGNPRIQTRGIAAPPQAPAPEETSAPATAESPPGADTQAEIPAPAPRAQSHPADSADLANRFDQGLSGIQHTVDKLNAKVDQFRHEHERLAAQFRKLLEEGNNAVDYSRRDLDRIFKAVSELRKPSNSGAPTPASNGALEARPSAAIPDIEIPSHPPSTTPPDAPTREGSEPAVTQESQAEGREYVQEHLQKPRPEPQPNSGVEASDVTEAALESVAFLDAASMDQLLDTPDHGINVEEINLSELDLDNPHGLPEGGRNEPPIHEDPVFFQDSSEGGQEQGWFFRGYGDRPHGPFADRETAQRVLKEMRERFGHGGQGAGYVDLPPEVVELSQEFEQKKAPGG